LYIFTSARLGQSNIQNRFILVLLANDNSVKMKTLFLSPPFYLSDSLVYVIQLLSGRNGLALQKEFKFLEQPHHKFYRTDIELLLGEVLVLGFPLELPQPCRISILGRSV